MAFGTLLKMLSLFWVYIKEQDKANNLKVNAIPIQRFLSSINKAFSPLCQLKIKSKMALYDMIRHRTISKLCRFYRVSLLNSGGAAIFNFHLRYLIKSIMYILNDTFLLWLHLSNCFKVSVFQKSGLNFVNISKTIVYECRQEKQAVLISGTEILCTSLNHTIILQWVWLGILMPASLVLNYFSAQHNW